MSRQIAFRFTMNDPTPTREQRLAQQLRANLRRRKAPGGKGAARAEDQRSHDLSKHDHER